MTRVTLPPSRCCKKTRVSRWIICFLVLLTSTIRCEGVVLSVPRDELAGTSVGVLAIFAGGGDYNLNQYSTQVDIYNATANSWRTAALSQARISLAATTVGSVALFAGGLLTGGAASSRVDLYNATTNTWSTASLSVARSHLAATTVGPYALFAGGIAGATRLATVDVYDSVSRTWNTSSLSQAREWLAATSVGSVAVFAGGATATSTPTATVDIVNATSQRWTTAVLSQARYALAATSVGNLAIFAGGTTGTSLSAQVDIYDVSTNSWSSICTLTAARDFLAATSLGTLAFFAGGQAAASYFSVVDVYDSSSSSWTTQSLSQPRNSLAATSVGGQVIFAGGGNSTGPTATVDMLAFGITTGTTGTTGITGTTGSTRTTGTTGTTASTGTTGTSDTTGSSVSAPLAAGNSSSGFSTTLLGIIVGAGGGGCLLLVVILVSVICVRKRSQKKRGASAEAAEMPSLPMSSSGASSSEGRVPYVSMLGPGTSSIAAAGTEYQAIARNSQANLSASVRAVPEDMRPWLIPYSELKVEQQIGKGAFGTVYKATWRRIPAAVKVLNRDKMSEKDIADFHFEAQLMRHLRPHTNVVLLLGVCEDPLCLVTEYAERGSLFHFLHSKAEIPPEVQKKIIQGTARGIYHLHLENIIHRDVSARNILLSGNFDARISDFGMSRFHSESGNSTQADTGPLKWMAPECLRNRVYSFQTDAWAFGVTLIEIFTRDVPFPSMDALEVATRVSSGELVPSPPEQAPEPVAGVMSACFAYKPDLRPTFEEITKTLDKW